MPEIAEVARIVHFLRRRLVGKRITEASAIDDNNVFGKVGTSGAEVEDALKGKTVVSVGCQGKYFWVTFDKPPHLVMHFGMTGWVHIKGERTAYTNYYKKMKGDDVEQWPPKFWKFHFRTDGRPGEQVAFTDARRFGRVRLVRCPGKDIRKHSPLVENGPDPVQDLDVFTEDYLRAKMRARHVPLKALLLDQTMISGIGNWVADETLYHAKLHPEQYCDDFTDGEIKKLYESVRYVCQLAVDKLGDSDEFPEHWLFNHRWGKGSKSRSSALPNGVELAFVTVGGRTSCYAPSVQQRTGKIAPGAVAEPMPDATIEEVGAKPSKKAPRWREADAEQVGVGDEPLNGPKRAKRDSNEKQDGRRRSTRLQKSR